MSQAIALKTGDAKKALDTLLAAGRMLEQDGDFVQQAALLSMWTGDYEQAKYYANQGDGPNYPAGRYLVRADAWLLVGDSERAIALYDSARVYLEGEVVADPPARLLAQAHALAGLGRKSDAQAVLDSLFDYITMRQRKYALSITAQFLPAVYVKLGVHEKALDILEREFDPPSFINEHVLRLEPRFLPLHNEPRFQALLNRKKSSS